MPGPQVSGPIATTSPTDVFGTHDASLGIDGLRSVADHTARNAVTTERRREGMIVYTRNDKEYWTLAPSPWNGTDSDWTLLEIGAGDHPDSQTFDFPDPETSWVMNHTLGGYPSVTARTLDNVTFIPDVSYTDTTQVVVNFASGKSVAGHAVLRNGG